MELLVLTKIKKNKLLPVKFQEVVPIGRDSNIAILFQKTIFLLPYNLTDGVLFSDFYTHHLLLRTL